MLRKKILRDIKQKEGMQLATLQDEHLFKALISAQFKAENPQMCFPDALLISDLQITLLQGGLMWNTDSGGRGLE